jgi:hypothetical protein
MDSDHVFSPHAFRAHIDDDASLPLVAPVGRYFHLVSNHVGAAPGVKKKYLVKINHGGKGSTPRAQADTDKARALKFSCLRLTERFAEFLNNRTVFPSGEEYWIVLEAEGYEASPAMRRLMS